MEPAPPIQKNRWNDAFAMKSLAPLLLILTLFAAALFIGIDGPFLRHREGVDAFYATVSRNHVRIGYGQTRLGMYEVSSPDLGVYPDWRTSVYPNRPFLTAFVTSLWLHALGDHEWVLRLSLIVVSMVSITGFWFLASRLLDPRWTALATALFALNPMFWYFSIVAVHLVYALGFSLAAWACHVRSADSRRFQVWTFIFVILACMSDWPGYYAALSIALDALLSRRRILALGLVGTAAACLGVHVIHLLILDPEHGQLVRRFFTAGSERSIQGLPSPVAFVKEEAREIGLYFTVGLLALAGFGVRRLTRPIWLLALLGLDEVLFMRWAYHHDFLTFPLAAFLALAAAKGAEALWTSPRRRLAAGALLSLAAVQSVWITADRLTRQGAYEISYRAGLAVREGTSPEDRVLLTIDDVRQFTPYYADRYTAGVEYGIQELMVHPSGRRFPVSRVEDLERYFGDYSVVLVGDPERAASEIRFFKGKRPPEGFRFLDPDQPLRQKLEAIAVSKETRGAFVLYRLRAPYSPK